VQIPVSAIIWMFPDMATFAVISKVKLMIFRGLLKNSDHLTALKDKFKRVCKLHPSSIRLIVFHFASRLFYWLFLMPSYVAYR
jgi:hypothetical protein